MLSFIELCKSKALSIGLWSALFVVLSVHATSAAGISVPIDIQDSGTKVTLLDIHFQDENKGWTVGAAGTMLQTEDGGKQWSRLPRRTNVLLTALTFVEDQHGWVVGQNGMILRYDGTVWTKMASGTDLHLFSVWGLPDSRVFAVGEQGTILIYK